MPTDARQHGHTPPDPDGDVAEGVGAVIAGWTIAAMTGTAPDPESMSVDDARRLRRVLAAVAALRAEGPGDSGVVS